MRRTLTLASPPSDEPPPSPFADDPLTRLWRNAVDRDTGHEAVEAIRARRREQAPERKSRRAR